MTPDPTQHTLTTAGLRLSTLSTGDSVTSCEVEDADGGWSEVVLGHRDLRSYARGGYLGATIGRVGNRIASGSFELDGTAYDLTVNDRGNTLHGGAAGFDLQEWRLVEEGPAHVTWGLVSPDGDQGFPGEVEVEVRYALAPETFTSCTLWRLSTS
ncbi:aldose 1-epimerase [Serinicoccus marinus]|uniref:aldose epimerase family protein n=1 Tax=Serinicoccus marinus TaxID=247333 RepID=UPI0003B44144|nr:aldose 1-epimerase [Serinicoccus marinus]